MDDKVLICKDRRCKAGFEEDTDGYCLRDVPDANNNPECVSHCVFSLAYDMYTNWGVMVSIPYNNIHNGIDMVFEI